MLNQKKKSNIGQINLAEVHFDYYHSDNYSLNSHKSPLRQRENLNSNIPLLASKPKKAISPIRPRPNAYHPPQREKEEVKKKTTQPPCQNHATKISKYYVKSQSEHLYYCESCALRLASQGFNTYKINDTGEKNSRMTQISQFMEELTGVVEDLRERQSEIDNELLRTSGKLDEEILKIQGYYGQFYELLDEHKSRVLDQLKTEYDYSSQSIRKLKQNIDDAIATSQNMKVDIKESINDVIAQASEGEFRPVMELYKNNLTDCKIVCQGTSIEPIKKKSIKFNGSQESFCQKILEELIIEWDEEERENSPEFSKTIKSINSEEGKNNLRELSRLFSSFDE